MSNRVQLAIDVVVLAYVGILIITALYYLLFEVDPSMTRLWHETVPNSTIRHDIRDVAEGLLGGLLGQQVVWNHYKKSVRKRPKLLDKIEIALHIPNARDGKPFSVGQLLVTPFLVMIYAIPGFVIGLQIATWIQHHHPSQLDIQALSPNLSPHSASIWQKMQTTLTADWDKKLIGYGSAFFFGRRPAKGVFDDVQLLFAERRVANNLGTRWYHPPTFKARVNDVAGGSTYHKVHGVWLKRIVIGLVPIGFVLAVFGWYVLAFIAK